MRAALLQMTSSDLPQDNLRQVLDLAERAVEQGAEFVLTPEVTNCLSNSRKQQVEVLTCAADDVVLQGLRDFAARKGVAVLAGSLAVKPGDPQDRFANRSFLIDGSGSIVATYDKIHMFDVTISESETYRESDGYAPGDRAVVADMPFGKVGMSICYDLRFARLYRTLAQSGAQILTVPSAFSPVTGAAHWETLLRARAIETGCFVFAPAQTGVHPTCSNRKPRRTWGHSMAVAPWGEVLLDAGTEPGVSVIDLDLDDVAKARARVPSLSHDRAFRAPS